MNRNMKAYRCENCKKHYYATKKQTNCPNCLYEATERTVQFEHGDIYFMNIGMNDLLVDEWKRLGFTDDNSKPKIDEMARRSQVSKSVIGELLNRGDETRHNPRFQTMVSLCRELNIELLARTETGVIYRIVG